MSCLCAAFLTHHDSNTDAAFTEETGKLNSTVTVCMSRRTLHTVVAYVK